MSTGSINDSITYEMWFPDVGPCRMKNEKKLISKDNSKNAAYAATYSRISIKK
jgi:hypothetical protein